MFRVALHISGIDLLAEDAEALAAGYADDLLWTSVNGRTIAVFYTESPIDAALAIARRVTHDWPLAGPIEVDLDLVGVADIARRASVSREAVRLWADGTRGPGEFPRPVGAVGGDLRGASRLWRWGEVSAWLRHHQGIGVGEPYDLDPRQLAEVNHALYRAASRDHEARRRRAA